MTAFPLNPVTDSYSYLRQHAQRLGCNPCFDHVPLETVLAMNERGCDEHLCCLTKMEFQCPCGGLTRMLEEDGRCYKNVFIKIQEA
jgi:hypothetical protein